MKKINASTIVLAIVAAAAATTAYKIKKLGPCSYESEEMARKAYEENEDNDTTD